MKFYTVELYEVLHS